MLNSLKIKDYIFLGRIYFISNDESQNMLLYQPLLDMLELKKTKAPIMLLVRNQGEYIIVNLSHYMLLFYIS